MYLFKMIPITLAILFAHSSLFALEMNVYKTKDWEDGFCAKVTLYNDSTKPEQWDISFDPKGTITKLWSANYEQNSTTLITHVRGLEWNEIIKSKHMGTFGYCANIK